ncbi:MAG: helix-hairpin-helix domain-containing protein [Vicinamibacterales bacterium]
MMRKALVVVSLVAAMAGGAFAETVGLDARQQSTAKPTVEPVVVNLNTASAADLEKLPGVGPAMAARIVEYREKNGGFKKVEELMNVKGIGEKTFLKLKPQLTVSPPKTGK